ncbi:unnamed protein product [Closterium sp. Yama58-4]|nr:unnamed protein product [Closterium sp. Yama58-4]
MAVDGETSEIAEAVKGLFGLVKGELATVKGELVAVRDEVALQKERVVMLEERNRVLDKEVNELMRAVGEKSTAAAAVVEMRGEEVALVKGELIAVREELAEHKASMVEKWDMVERKRESDMRELREANTKGEQKMKAELSKVREEWKGGVQSVSEAVEAVMASMATAHMEKEAMEMKMRALGVQLEETRRELAAAKGELAEYRSFVTGQAEEITTAKGELGEQKNSMRGLAEKLAAVNGELVAAKEELAAQINSLTGQAEELAAVKGELAEIKTEFAEGKGEVAAVKREVAEQTNRVPKLEVAFEEALLSLVRGDWGSPQAMEAVSSAFSGETKRRTILDLKDLSNLSDLALHVVSTMAHLKKIWLNKSSGFSAEGIKHLYRLPQELTSLDLKETPVSDGALEGIGGVRRLEWLVVSSTNVTDAGLLHLTGLSSLKVLSISGCKGVTSAGMERVGGLASLEQLWASATGVKNDGLQHLTSLTRLKLLSVGPGCSNVDMEHIVQLTSLEDLRLWGGAVTHTGAQCLQRLPCLKRFRSSIDGLEARVKALLPGVRVGG